MLSSTSYASSQSSSSGTPPPSSCLERIIELSETNTRAATPFTSQAPSPTSSSSLQSSSNTNPQQSTALPLVAPTDFIMNTQQYLSPVFLDPVNRQYVNPISYLGGPRLDTSNKRTSIESVLSID